MEKKYVAQHETPVDLKEHYTADAYTIRCFDKRFAKATETFIEECGVRNEDPGSPAGGAKIFAAPEQESDTDFFFREIEKSIRLHHTTRVILFTHSDCGAYGSLARFDGDEAKEFEFHTGELKKAEARVRERFPDLAVETYFVDKNGVVQVM